MEGKPENFRPAGYTSKLDVVLDAEMRADAALRVVLRRLLQTLQDNLEGTRRAADEEYLHDFRVAIRRTRSCLSQIKKVFPAAEIKPYRKELAWLGTISGPLRDLDVFLLQLRSGGDELPRGRGGALTPLIEFLEQRQREEHRRLVEQLDSERFRRFLESWRRFLEPAEPSPEAPARAAVPIVSVAARRIARAHARVLELGRCIDDRSAAARLHRLRIECKKLRYLLEFFRSLFDPEQLDPIVRSLKRLQDCLGDFNDLAVQQDSLRDAAERMEAAGALPGATAAAIEQLIERLAQRQQRKREQFARRFSTFDAPETRRRMALIAGRETRQPCDDPAPEDREAGAT